MMGSWPLVTARLPDLARAGRLGCPGAIFAVPVLGAAVLSSELGVKARATKQAVI